MPAKTSKKNSRKSEHKKKVKQEEVLVGAGPTPVGMTDQDLEFVAEAREDRRRKVEKAGKGKNCTCTIF